MTRTVGITQARFAARKLMLERLILEKAYVNGAIWQPAAKPLPEVRRLVKRGELVATANYRRRARGFPLMRKYELAVVP